MYTKKKKERKNLLVPCVLYGIYWITFVEYIYTEREREIYIYLLWNSSLKIVFGVLKGAGVAFNALILWVTLLIIGKVIKLQKHTLRDCWNRNLTDKITWLFSTHLEVIALILDVLTADLFPYHFLNIIHKRDATFNFFLSM